jgi:hypothetical protein
MTTATAVQQQQPDPSATSASPFHQPARDNAGNLTEAPASHTRAPPNALEWTRMSPEQRAAYSPAPRTGGIADSVYDRLGPDEQSRYARVRAGPDGGSEWVARDQLGTEPGSKPDAPAAGEKHKFGEFEFTEAELSEFLTSKADAELRKASLPATPADYKAELPANFEMPAGVEVKIDEADPLLIDARNWAHSKGLDQATFSEMVGLYASSKAKETAQLNAAHADQVAKMGANGTQRVSALEVWLRGMVGDKLAGPMRSMMVTADIVKGLETLQQKFSSQGSASFSQAHRAPQEPQGRISDDEYSRMSPAARLDYARQFDQSQFRDAR